jgi:hypothetical protein
MLYLSVDRSTNEVELRQIYWAISGRGPAQRIRQNVLTNSNILPR